MKLQDHINTYEDIVDEILDNIRHAFGMVEEQKYAGIADELAREMELVSRTTNFHELATVYRYIGYMETTFFEWLKMYDIVDGEPDVPSGQLIDKLTNLLKAREYNLDDDITDVLDI